MVMGEDYMETKQNGHEMKDMYNPDTSTLDIHSKVKTILTPSEFCSILTEMRDRYDRRDITRGVVGM